MREAKTAESVAHMCRIDAGVRHRYGSRGHYILWRQPSMRCPWCDADEDRVVDSRPADSGATIRRRRECGACSRRYTTFERIEDVGLVVIKREGSKEPFDRAKLAGSIRKALADRPVTSTEVEIMVDRIQARLRRRGPEIASHLVGHEVLGALRRTDEVAYLRFASVYKEFEGVADFEREMVSLQKKVPAKRKRPT